MISKKTVAAFDFDGTITYCDSLIPFLFYSKGVFKTTYYLFLMLPTFFQFVLKKKSRQQVKEALLALSFANFSQKEMNDAGTLFAENGIPFIVRKEALKRLKWHQQQNHHCILVSASIDCYLLPWAKKVGFQDVISSKLAVDAEGRVSGALKGLNCRGPEKVRRLQQVMGNKDGYILYAYGDSEGDKELLEYADYPFYRFF